MTGKPLDSYGVTDILPHISGLSKWLDVHILGKRTVTCLSPKGICCLSSHAM